MICCEKIKLSPCTPLQDLCGQGSPKSKVPTGSLNAKTNKFKKIRLRDGTIVPDVTMVGERVGNIAQLALLCILCKGAHPCAALRSRVGAKGCWRHFFKNPTTQLRVVWELTEKKCEQTPKFACFSV